MAIPMASRPDDTTLCLVVAVGVGPVVPVIKLVSAVWMPSSSGPKTMYIQRDHSSTVMIKYKHSYLKYRHSYNVHEHKSSKLCTLACSLAKIQPGKQSVKAPFLMEDCTTVFRGPSSSLMALSVPVAGTVDGAVRGAAMEDERCSSLSKQIIEMLIQRKLFLSLFL